MTFFFFNDTATTEIYTLSLHDALPICCILKPNQSSHGIGYRAVATIEVALRFVAARSCGAGESDWRQKRRRSRSEEHTSELQSPDHLVCRLLLEKKKQQPHMHIHISHCLCLTCVTAHDFFFF